MLLFLVRRPPPMSTRTNTHFPDTTHFRSLRGTANVTCNDKNVYISEDQSTYIPLGNTHRLENPCKVPLELIEVQSGCYLGEDDIVRMSDSYGRSETRDAPAKAIA